MALSIDDILQLFQRRARKQYGREAVSQMDQVTQQNAALVEQIAAAASGLRSQAQELVQTVSAFKLAASEHRPVFDVQVAAIR